MTRTCPWRPIPLADFQVPEQDAKEGLRRLWRWLRRTAGRGDDAPPLRDPEPVPAAELAHLVPSLDHDRAARGLAAELADWREAASGAPRAVVVVGPPGSEVPQVVAAWARQAELPVLAAPPRRPGGADHWQEQLADRAPGHLVLPPLEQLFLRRHGGLEGLRALLQRLQHDQHRFVAACGSWAWSFLRRALGDRAGFDRVLAPAPFTAAVLREWLAGLDPEVRFVESETGATMALAAGEDTPPRFLRALAARARGIPGVATGIWRGALGQARVGRESDGSRHCLLPAWGEVSPPELPAQTDKVTALVLHAILLHGALDDESLLAVLPHDAARSSATLWGLQGEGILERRDGQWHVTTIGYPAVRAFLAARNVPLDDF